MTIHNSTLNMLGASDGVVVFQRPAPLPASISRPTRMFGATPATKQLALAKNYLLKGPVGDRPCTHVTYGDLYRMGKLSVPPGDATWEYAKAYCLDFYAGWVSAMSENKPQNAAMRFYIDYDFVEDVYPSEDTWRALEIIEKQELTRFFAGKSADDRLFNSTVATSGVVDVVNEDGVRQFKTGIHVYYPNLYVSVEMALYISTAIISSAKKRWPKADGVWEKTIDQKVYADRRGLRWVYQGKAKPCEHCKDAKRSGPGTAKRAWCQECDSTGQVVDLNASMYAPLYRVDGEYKRTAIVPAARYAPTPELMMECSLLAIFSPEPSSGFALYPGAEPIPVLKATKASQVKVVASGDIQIKAAIKSSASEPVAASSAVYSVLQNAIRALDPMYAAVDIRHALKYSSSSKSTFYRVYVCGKGSGYCMNMGRDHHKARVYFVVMKSGLRQKCCCECPTAAGRTSGKPCKLYESTPTPVREQDTFVLFNSSSRNYSAVSTSARAGVAAVSSLPATDDSAFSDTVVANAYLKAFRLRRPQYDVRGVVTPPP
jgi:hypothetical protein